MSKKIVLTEEEKRELEAQRSFAKWLLGIPQETKVSDAELVAMLRDRREA